MKKNASSSGGAPASRPGIRAEAKPLSDFPIVGIGASAGGLAAFEAFFSAMPTDVDPGMAFVLVQHLAPDHKSILTELVKRYTRMQVLEVEDGMVVKPNCAYIIPPNCDMALLNGSLQLLEPVAPRGQRLPIDFFFRSLAQDQHERAICVVLSGTGSDGTLGVRAVKGEGGAALAQSLDSTEYDGMPRSAIATGLIDFVLPPAEMPAQLIAYAARAFARLSRKGSAQTLNAEDSLTKIFVLLRAQTDHDFSQYKQNTIVRRIERRMAVQQIERLDHYVRYLQRTPAEVDALFRDLLIGVTSFFRDPIAFAALEALAIPRLFADQYADHALRVWVPGCSTGEEAYSLAILLQERIDTLGRNRKAHVFATDIDRHAIAHARAGVYPASIATDVSAERLARFFVPEPDGCAYRIRNDIRDMLVFSDQDVIKDPPFSKLDLLSCRNLMIYMGADLQRKLIPLFHYALNPGGCLFLGTSESVGEFTELFAPLDRKSRLYLRAADVPGARHTAMGAFPPQMAGTGGAPPRARGANAAPAPSLQELAERALLQHYDPVGALVDGHGTILYLYGRTGRYLEPAPGEAVMNILKMAREGLRREMAAALRQAAANGSAAYTPGLRVRTNGDFTTVNLTVQPLATGRDSQAAPPLYLVVLDSTRPSDRPQTAALESIEAAGGSAIPVDERIAALTEELRSKEEHLQAISEELEASNQELRSFNEELQSVNEESQSTNEELETSREELQSINEELTTVNAELQQRVTDLSRANNDMNNLLAGTGIATVFVDRELRIMRFTPATTQVINLISSDVGRPMGDIVSNLQDYDSLPADVESVLETLTPKDMEVRTRMGAWYLLRIRLYRTLENVIEGAVITFSDISDVKRAQAVAQEARALHRLGVVVRDAYDAVMMVDLEGNIQAWNPGAERLYGWTEIEALALTIGAIAPEDQRKDSLASLLQTDRTAPLAPRCVKRITKDGQLKDVWMIATSLVNEAGTTYAIAITERECAPQARADGRAGSRKERGDG